MTNRRKVIVHIATSADGYVARCDGDLEWLTSRLAPKGFYGMNAFMKSIDGARSCEVSMRVTWLLVAVLSNALVAQEPAKPLQIDFTASAASFDPATNEYREIWATEGARIVVAIERATGLRFEPGPIRAVIYEGPSFSGFRERPMQLRASYSPATKRATVVHELGHRLMGDLVPRDIDHHSIIFLFVYDVWVELWGQSFADEQVAIERKRTGALANYDALWTQALAISPTERARRFQKFVREHRK